MRRDSRRRIVKSKIPSVILADKTMVKLPYERQLTLNIPVGNFSVNSAIPLNYVDPTGFPASAGNMPLGLLNWANFYGAFRILGSKISVEFFSINSSIETISGDPIPLTVGIFPVENWIPGASPAGSQNNTNTAQPYSKYRTIAIQSNGGANRARISSYMSSKKMAGQRVTEENDFQQNFSYTAGSPSALSTIGNAFDWFLFAQTMDEQNIIGPTGGAVVLANMKITYYAQLEDRLGQGKGEGPPA